MWPASWAQFRRYAGLAGRLTYWQCVWAAAWRSAIAFGAVWLGSGVIEMLSEGRISDDLFEMCFFLGLVSTVFLAIIMKLSVPGRLRPPSNVCLVDIALNAIPFGLLSLAGLVLLSELSDEKFQLTAPGMIVILFLGMAIGAIVRWLRWINARSAIEPDGASHMVRPATALGLSAWACIVLAHLWPSPEIAAAAFLVIMPTSCMLATLDVWLEMKGPRTQLPLDSRNERRWLLPVVAGVSVVTVVSFLTVNLRPPSIIAQGRLAEVAAPQESKAGDRQVLIPVGAEIKVHVEKDGLYSIKAVSDREGLQVWPQVRNTTDGNLIPQYDETIVLFKGEYKVCATTESYSYRCLGVYPDTLIEHMVLAFGLLDVSASATLTFRYVREPTAEEYPVPSTQ